MRRCAYRLIAASVIFCTLGCMGITPPAFVLPALNSTDFARGYPRAEVVWPDLMLDCSMGQSTYGLQLTHVREKDSILLRGRYVAPKRAPSDTERRINLEKLGFEKDSLNSLTVHWINRDGSRTRIYPSTQHDKI